jgi:hypothetical protein
VSVRLRWDQAADKNLTAANHFMLQSDGHDFYLTVGHLAPPAVAGTQEEQAAELRRLDSVQVTVAARYIISRSRLRELRDLLVRAPLGDEETEVTRDHRAG